MYLGEFLFVLTPLALYILLRKTQGERVGPFPSIFCLHLKK